MKKKSLLILLLILLLAGFLRFYRLGSNPPAITWDEAAWGYNAYSLGATGRDEFGRLLPLNYLESFGDFKPPVYVYLTILPVKIFGLNEFNTRFAAAFFGTLTVLLTYFLVKELFQNSHLLPTGGQGVTRNALTTSFLLAISPWHIMLSRAAFEANVATFFLVAGVTFFLMAVNRHGWWLVLSALSFILSLQTFNTGRIVAPLLVLGLVVGLRHSLWKIRKWAAISGVLGILLLTPLISFYISPQARLRFKEVNIFSDPGIVTLANQEIANDGNVWWSKIIHNRRWGYAREYLRHYFDHFNPVFLFIKGDGNPKFSIQDVGELYLWELPFLIIGILFLIKQKKGFWWLIFYWLLVGIIPAATARETPHALRIETTLPTWQIITAVGVTAFLQYIKRYKRFVSYGLRVTGCGLLFLNFVYFQHNYWFHYPVQYSGEWQYGYKDAISFVRSVENDYGQVWFTDELGRPYIYFLYYLKINPKDFWRKAIIKRDVFGFVEVESFDKYHFFRSTDANITGKTLVIEGTGNIPQGGELLKTFYLLNGKEILKAYEI
jgi:4-amino-4-deoxy-L-arabinose transferase-like glycosyltransferase